jgi:hypothetical protein
MNIYEALEQIPYKKREYFKWKHDIRYNQTLPKKSEAEFLKMIGLKSLNSFKQWERSQEYKSLLMLLLESKIANDFDEIYKTVSEKSKQGDEKAIRLFLSMQKDIQQNAKMAAKIFDKVEDKTEEDDDLVLD